jgi:hypothetical protein
MCSRPLQASSASPLEDSALYSAAASHLSGSGSAARVTRPSGGARCAGFRARWKDGLWKAPLCLACSSSPLRLYHAMGSMVHIQIKTCRALLAVHRWSGDSRAGAHHCTKMCRRLGLEPAAADAEASRHSSSMSDTSSSSTTSTYTLGSLGSWYFMADTCKPRGAPL